MTDNECSKERDAVIQTARQRDRETKRQTDRQTDRQTSRQIEKEMIENAFGRGNHRNTKLGGTGKGFIGRSGGARVRSASWVGTRYSEDKQELDLTTAGRGGQKGLHEESINHSRLPSLGYVVCISSRECALMSKPL